MMLYVVEILPYSMRAKGISLFWLITGIAGAFNTYVNPIGLKRFGYKFYYFYVVWIAVEFAVVFWQCPETMGTSLEDVALIIDGDEAKISKVNPVAEAMGKREEKEVTNQAVVEHVEKSG